MTYSCSDRADAGHFGAHPPIVAGSARRCRWLGAVAMALCCAASGADSECYGTVSNGRLVNAVALPVRGTNFSAYSSLGGALGRTFLHSKVRDIVLAAYAVLEATAPDKIFVYGETGARNGGKFRPHRTHQNGLSVDFFVPVKDRTGKSAALPTGAGNRWGYDIEFDANAEYGDYAIDFEALAEHLFQLDSAAKARGAAISLVIFDPPFLPKLFATARGPYLKQSLPFMRGKAWWRHDEHYHVDFSVPCAPLSAHG